MPFSNASGGKHDAPDRMPLFPAAHFRVLLGDEGGEVTVRSVSPLHDWADREGEAPKTPPRGKERGAPAVLDPSPSPVLPPQRVTLTRAIDGDRTLWLWNREAAGGKATPRDVTLLLLSGPDGPPVHAWVLREARPLRWSGPAFDAMTSGLAMEEMEVTYARVDWIDAGTVSLPPSPPPPPGSVFHPTKPRRTP